MSYSSHSAHSSMSTTSHTVIAVGALALSGVLAWGAASISGQVGYGGVGPNFLPWVVSAALLVCGLWLLWEARTGGYRKLDAASGAAQGDWAPMLWVSAGVLANAALITTIGFVLSCALCFVLAVRGLRLAEKKGAGTLRQTVVDTVTGLLIAAPVYWLFGKVLGINLPGISGTGWI